MKLKRKCLVCGREWYCTPIYIEERNEDCLTGCEEKCCLCFDIKIRFLKYYLKSNCFKLDQKALIVKVL